MGEGLHLDMLCVSVGKAEGEGEAPPGPLTPHTFPPALLLTAAMLGDPSPAIPTQLLGHHSGDPNPRKGLS